MRAPPSYTPVLLLLAVVSGCGGGGSDPNPPPPDSELTTVEVAPAAKTLFSLPPENQVSLVVTAKDQDGALMDDLPDPVFSSDDEGVATVDAEGKVTAAAAGTARITTSLTVEGITKTGTTDITVVAAPAAQSVGAPQLKFLPEVVDVAAGGEVTWSVGSLPHDVKFSSPGAPADIPEMENQSESRTFPTAGTYGYRCTLHVGMTGTVRVH